mgnify:CR=1 FL=1
MLNLQRIIEKRTARALRRKRIIESRLKTSGEKSRPYARTYAEARKIRRHKQIGLKKNLAELINGYQTKRAVPNLSWWARLWKWLFKPSELDKSKI